MSTPRLTAAQARVLESIDRGADSIVWSTDHRCWMLLGGNTPVKGATFWSLFKRRLIRAVGEPSPNVTENLYEQSPEGHAVLAAWREARS